MDAFRRSISQPFCIVIKIAVQIYRHSAFVAIFTDMKPAIFLCCLLVINNLHSQLFDNFNDGDFSSNPAWSGNSDRFAVNANGELQLQDIAPGTNNISYLSVAAPTSLRDFTMWEFYVRLEFATSTSNFARVYLASSSANLNSDLNGYYLRIGGTTGNDDALELYRQDGSRNLLVLKGTTGAVGGATATARVRITRTPNGEWTLFADYTGGTNYQNEGSAIDTVHRRGDYFGFYCRYTSTRSRTFFFDDVKIDPLYQDTTPPQLLSAEALSSSTLELIFDEPLTDGNAQQPANYSINNGVGPPKNAVLVEPEVVFIELDKPLKSGVRYTLTASNIADLAGNTGRSQTADFTFYDIQPPLPGDLIINEVLYQPEVGGSRFIELYNNSNKTLNLNGLEIVNAQKTSGNVRQSIRSDFLLLPDAYVAITDNPQDILSRYPGASSRNLLRSGVPTLDAGSGNVSIRTVGVTLDSFDYSDQLHFALLTTRRGVSLERLSPNAPTNSPGNWHSAASTAGFATPGYQNSQFFVKTGVLEHTVNIPRKTFSPDGDGFEDVLLIEYATDQPGATLSIRIFDAQGRLVRRLMDNELLAAQGSFKWDGVADNGQRARIGIYVLWVEMLTAAGNVERQKISVTLAGKLD